MKPNPFQRGDKVEAVDETLQGTVIRIEGSLVIFIDDDGFEYRYPADKLVRANFLDEFPRPGALIPRLKNDISRPKTSSQNRKNKIPEIDLHASALPTLPPGALPDEILRHQLNHLKRFLRQAHRKNISKFIVIHGCGKGILRRKALQMVRKAGYVTYDAPYARYGQGAFTAEKK